MSSSSIQKTPVPKQLLGVPSDYEYSETTSGNTLYPYEYKNKGIYIDMEYRHDITLIFYKYNDDNPIYLDIKVHSEHHRTDYMPKMIYLKYSDESEKTILYEHTGSQGSSTIFPLLQGWHAQKRRNRSGGPVPQLLKL